MRQADETRDDTVLWLWIKPDLGRQNRGPACDGLPNHINFVCCGVWRGIWPIDLGSNFESAIASQSHLLPSFYTRDTFSFRSFPCMGTLILNRRSNRKMNFWRTNSKKNANVGLVLSRQSVFLEIKKTHGCFQFFLVY